MKTKTNEEVYISNYDKCRKATSGLRKRKIIIAKDFTDINVELVDGRVLKTYYRPQFKELEIHSEYTITTKKNFWGKTTRGVTWLKDIEEYYRCQVAYLDDITTGYFMGEIEDYYGYIPKEACVLIGEYKKSIAENKNQRLVILDIVPNRFSKVERPKGDPILGIVEGDSFYQIIAWLG